MRVVVPYTKLHPDVEPALPAVGIEAWFVHVPKWDSYSKLLGELWQVGETFVLIEQDIVVRPGVVEELFDCPEPWCGFVNDVGIGIYPTLGCTKFASELMVRFPMLMEQAKHKRVAELRAGHWRHFDVAIEVMLHSQCEVRGPHAHRPEVLHASFAALSALPQCRWCRKRIDLSMEDFRAIKERFGYAVCGWCLPIEAGVPYTWRLKQLAKERAQSPPLGEAGDGQKDGESAPLQGGGDAPEDGGRAL